MEEQVSNLGGAGQALPSSAQQPTQLILRVTMKETAGPATEVGFSGSGCMAHFEGRLHLGGPGPDDPPVLTI